MGKEKENLLALILIDSSMNFSNSYNLCRVLSRIFGLVNCQEIISHLKEQDYIEVGNTNYGVDEYLIKDTGRQKINLNKVNFIKDLLQAFPGEKDFILKLL